MKEVIIHDRKSIEALQNSLKFTWPKMPNKIWPCYDIKYWLNVLKCNIMKKPLASTMLLLIGIGIIMSYACLFNTRKQTVSSIQTSIQE